MSLICLTLKFAFYVFFLAAFGYPGLFVAMAFDRYVISLYTGGSNGRYA